MCYRPIRLFSNKKDFDSRFDKVFFEVPCGKCCECTNAKVTSWSLRNYYEFLNCKNNGGIVFNFTLTYNNEHLPKQYGIGTFDKLDVQKFLKLLRKWLIKDGYIKDGSLLRYFLTSEFGHLHGRPHYHIIFYLYVMINPLVFYRYVQKYWSRGFVGYGSLGMEVKDYHALQYACKYITKDSSYQSVIDAVKLKYQELSDDKDCIYFDDFFKRFRSFHLESKGFGKCALCYITDEQFFLGRVLSPFGTGKETLPIPLYLIRKVFYDEITLEDGTRRYQLNKKGIHRNIHNMSNQIIRATDRLNDYRQYPNDFDLLNELHEDSIDTFFHKLDGYMKLFELPLYTLFVYKFIYRDRCISDIGTSCYLDLSKFLFRYAGKYGGISDEYKINVKLVNELSQKVCNELPIFRKFETFLGQLSAFIRYDAYNKQIKTIEEYNIKQSQVALQRGSVPIYKPLPDKRDFFTYLLT